MDRRPDCDYFEPKQHAQQRGDCQTDGHYLCSNCKHIASFEQMELSDNRIRYYGIEEVAKLEEEKEKIRQEYLLQQNNNNGE